MRGIQFVKNTICFPAVLLILICMVFLLLFTNIDVGLLIQDFQTADITQDSITPRGIGKLHQYPPAYICIQQTPFYQDAQRLLSCKNNSLMTSFYGAVYGLFFHTTARFISLSDQISLYKINDFLIALYCPNAPPAF